MDRVCACESRSIACVADCVGRGGSIQLGWAGARSGTVSQLAATPAIRELIDDAPRTLHPLSINQSIDLF